MRHFNHIAEFVVQAANRKGAIHMAVGQLFRGERILSTRKGW